MAFSYDSYKTTQRKLQKTNNQKNQTQKILKTHPPKRTKNPKTKKHKKCPPKTTNPKLNWDHRFENVQSFIIFPISNTCQLQNASVLLSELKPHEVKYQTLKRKELRKFPRHNLNLKKQNYKKSCRAVFSSPPWKCAALYYGKAVAPL